MNNNKISLLATLVCCSSLSCFAQESGAQRPNIIFLLADDLRYDALSYTGKEDISTPNLDALARDGVSFSNAYCTTPISCCSRASILTGQYSRTSGFVDFGGNLTGEQLAATYPMLMKSSGYRVGFIGKYGVGGYMPKEEFDFWRGFAGQGTYYRKDESGDPIHSTKLMSTQIDEFLDESNSSQPFCLSVSFKAPHTESERDPFPYDKSYEQMYADSVFVKAQSFGAEHYAQLPEAFRRDEKWENEAHVRFENRFGTEEKYQSSLKGYYRLIAGIDQTVKDLRIKLDQMGIADNTIIIFTSDNGYFLGEHGFEGKWYGHEESIRLPLVIYDPRCDTGVAECDKIVLNVDYPATMLDYAGVEIPEEMQGRSLRALCEGQVVKDWREDFVFEHLMNLDKSGWFVFIPQSEGIVKGGYKYTRYFVNNDRANPIYEEFFDFEKDPCEMTNLIDKKRGKATKYQKLLERRFLQIKSK